jgi:tripartite-type tricarboxylate transporter receptor subunit TctC
MTITRRMFLYGLAITPFATRSIAAEWPSGPIRLVVPFPPGGSVDAVARLISPGLGARLGANVFVENISGASGSAGTAAAVRAQPDGKTWLVAFDTHAVNPSLMPDLPYDTKNDLTPVFLLGTAPHILAAPPSSPFKNLADVIAAAKMAPDTITYASTGTGTLGNLTMVRLLNMAGAKLVHVPYRGGGPAVADALGGQVDLVIGSAALLMQYVKADKLRPIVLTGKERLTGLSELQTVGEAGYPGSESYAWWGIFAPKGTPQPIIDRFERELRLVLEDAGVTKQLTEAQQMTLAKGGPQELKAFFEEQIEIWGRVIKENNIKINS